MRISAGIWGAPESRATGDDRLSADEVRARIEVVQAERALEHVPMIYAVALFNIMLIMVLCFHKEVPVSNYGWMGVVAILSALRMIQWIRRARLPDRARDPRKTLRSLTIVSIGMISGLSAWSVYALTSPTFADMILIPVSLVFGSTCIAHCLAPIRRAAIGALIIGVMPAATYLLLFGDFEGAILGASMISIAILMIVFLMESYQRIVDGIILEEKILRLANTDPLTGLANRRAIMDALDAADAASAEGVGYAIAILDLNGFKRINDTLGHHVGDTLLQIVADRLREAAEPGELVGRLGGDEFLVLMPAVTDEVAASARTSAFLLALSQPARVEGHRIPVSGSIGHALSGCDGVNADAVMMVADRALYALKRGDQGPSDTAAVAARQNAA
ncbi:diguanylate cyclase [Parasphingopyxis algicola]|uniref:GGDEF domain-containing protein n=1 Tax=Parasphingopyxis algicola TaxID=2026624 RepID=UPI0015A45361|nr:diguanylate cyclase [Parasphingopyxis algicola]QLC25459.1 diguanylate cyclase [Parasphingopyxis algicola]